MAGRASRVGGWWLWPALVLALPLLLRLGAAPLFDVDEGAFAEASREMWASGDWGHTTLNGAPRFDKPIGVYWLQAPSLAWLAPLIGLEAAVRLPSALAMWALALALVAFARPRWGAQAALLAGLMVVSSLGLLAIGRAATADALLNLLLVLTGLDLWRFLEHGRLGPLRRAALWAGLGLLVKGPVALLVPGLAALVWLLAGRQWARGRALLTDRWAWALMLGVALPWYAYAWHRHGMAFVDGFLLRHNLQRYTGALEGHGGGLGYYLLMLPLLLLPWSGLLWPLLRGARQAWAEPLPRYLLGWAGAVLLFFSLSGTKLPHYVLYGTAPLLLLMARLLAHQGAQTRALVAAGLVLTSVVLAAAPWAVVALAGQIRSPLYRALLASAPQPGLTALVLLPGLVLIVGLAGWGSRAAGQPGRQPGPTAPWRDTAGRLRPAAHPALAAWLLALVVGAVAMPWWGEALQGPVRRAAALARTGGIGPAQAVVQDGVDWPSFALYRGAATPRRVAQPHDAVLTRADRLPAGAPRPRWFDERGVVLLGPVDGAAVTAAPPP